MGYKLLNLIMDTFNAIQKPMTPKEIWNHAKLLGFVDRLNGYGKTPESSIGSIMYLNVRDNPNSVFVKVEKGRFCLKSLMNTNTKLVCKYNERDLHILLSTFVYQSPHFKCYTKTIYHEKSSKGEKGKNKWLHPDIVGVYYPFDDYQEETIITMNSLGENPCKIFSFEMKIDITPSNLREYFFQAVSNSTWANEGYLVTLHYDSNILDEMRRLNNAFGIGLIELNPQDVKNSQIVFNAKEKLSLDWDMINRLTEENDDFKEFICTISEDLNLRKVKNPQDYDMFFTKDDDIFRYIDAKGIR